MIFIKPTWGGCPSSETLGEGEQPEFAQCLRVSDCRLGTGITITTSSSLGTWPQLVGTVWHCKEMLLKAIFSGGGHLTCLVYLGRSNLISTTGCIKPLRTQRSSRIYRVASSKVGRVWSGDRAERPRATYAVYLIGCLLMNNIYEVYRMATYYTPIRRGCLIINIKTQCNRTL